MAFKRIDERKEKILRAATDEYINTAEPVGSRTIARKYDLGLSPATIRNEMADLEESGFLQQPHTSAGRIPSTLGYRYYVDALMQHRALSTEEETCVRGELETRRREIDSLLTQTSRVLSQLTRYPSMVLGPEIDTAVFRHIQLVPLDTSDIMVVIVTGSGRVEHCVLETQSPLGESDLSHISGVLNRYLKGRSFADIRSSLFSEIRSEILANDRFFEEMMGMLSNSLRTTGAERVRVDGTTSIMEQPEFREVEKLRPLFALLSGEGPLSNLLAGVSGQSGVHIRIGEESGLPDMHECSVVTSTYEVGGHTMGVIGVLGPTRMEYNRVVSVVEYVSACLSEVLTRMSRGG